MAARPTRNSPMTYCTCRTTETPFPERPDRHAAEPGFALALAYNGELPVGYAYGNTGAFLPAVVPSPVAPAPPAAGSTAAPGTAPAPGAERHRPHRRCLQVAFGGPTVPAAGTARARSSSSPNPRSTTTPNACSQSAVFPGE